MAGERLWVPATNLGDSAVLLPLALVILAWISPNAWRLSSALGGLLAADMVLVALTKIACMGWGLHPPAIAAAYGGCLKIARPPSTNR